MSETIEAIGPNGDAGPSVTTPLPPSARMRWMADLVCAILDAETDRKATVVGSRSDTSRHAGNS
jgi:hypothetical protein